MMYEARSPPKITTSEAKIHHTASLPVAIPVAARPVAIGLICVSVSGGSGGQEGAFWGQ